jgi:hypothetical protein
MRKGGLKPGSMTQDHKDALAAGRTQSRAVRAYLEALEKNPPKRGRKRTLAKVRSELAEVANEMVNADTLRRLELVQKRLDLQAEIARMENAVDPAALEPEFIAVAKAYSENKGISFEAWRTMGVSDATLRAAGITRSMRTSIGDTDVAEIDDQFDDDSTDQY